MNLLNLLFVKELQITSIYTLLMIVLYLVRSTQANQLQQSESTFFAHPSTNLLTFDRSERENFSRQVHLEEWIKRFNRLNKLTEPDHLNKFGNLKNFVNKFNSKLIRSNRVYLKSSNLNENLDKLRKHLSRQLNNSTLINSDNASKLTNLLKLRKLFKRNVSNEDSKQINKVTKPTNYSSSKKNTKDDELYEIPNFLVVILTICYSSISFMAVAGNLIILWIVIKIKKMRNPTNYLLANLSASDFLIGAFSIPFQYQAALLQKWILPSFLCRLCPTIQVVSHCCSVLTITVLSLDRFRAVLYPLKTKTSKLKSKLIILIIWFTSIMFSLPTFMAYDVELVLNEKTGIKDQYFCNIINISLDYWKIYTYTLFILQYLLPTIVCLYAYLRIGLNLFASNGIANSTSNRSDLSRMMKNKRRVIKMLFVMALFLCLGWLPFQVYQLLCEIYPPINNCHLLAMSNSLCQPLILFIYSEKWKIEIIRLINVHFNFFCNGVCEKCLPRSTIQRTRYNLNHDHTNFSSNLNNAITSNCTSNLSNNNNLFYSTTTNKLSSTPNRSNLDSSSLVENANTECIEFERLNKFNNRSKRLNGDRDCEYSIYELNTKMNASVSSLNKSVFFRPDNRLTRHSTTTSTGTTKQATTTNIDRLFSANLVDNLDNKNQVTNLLYLTIRLSSLIINQHLIKLLNVPNKRINKTITFKSLNTEPVSSGSKLGHHAYI